LHPLELRRSPEYAGCVCAAAAGAKKTGVQQRSANDYTSPPSAPCARGGAVLPRVVNSNSGMSLKEAVEGNEPAGGMPQGYPTGRSPPL